MEGDRACLDALDYLVQSEKKPVSEWLPGGSASFYIPARSIGALLKDQHRGLTLEKIFLCPCNRCSQDGGSVDERLTHYNRLREKELRDEYAAIYALLIYIRRQGLIRKFQKHGLKLQDTRYLTESDLHVLSRERIADFQLLQRKVVDTQYSFLVRTLKPFSEITAISPKEVLPIKEDLEPKGVGTFAEVRCFEFQDDEYRSREFGEHITKFARKIFKQGMKKSAAKEWNNLQMLSKMNSHPHIMVALGAYWHGRQFFILMEEAELSLQDYLNSEGVEFDSQELWKQMGGAADGLSTLHGLYADTRIAYHQDLKPANILIVRGRFKIADFGLLEFKPISTDDGTGATGIPNAHNTGFYAAPRQATYTRGSDIWSLGCIMSEIATCDIQGRDEVRKYHEARVENKPMTRDFPRFFFGDQVKGAVLGRHILLQSCVETQKLADRGVESMEFRRKFYTDDFFELLHAMFNVGGISNEHLTFNKATGPDAAQVCKTIERLHHDAGSEFDMDNVIDTLTLEQRLLDDEALDRALTTHLSEFERVLNKRDPGRLLETSADDFKQFLVNLQEKQHAERRQQGLKRLSIFLERIEQYEELVERLPIAARIGGSLRGPLKFLLASTDSHQDAFSNIVDLYDQIGMMQPTISMYKELAIGDSDLIPVISSMYAHILEVNRLLLVYFQQRLWSELFATSWKRHKARMQGVLTSMKSLYDLIRGKAEIVQFNSFLAGHSLDGEQMSTLEDENLSRGQAVHAWLEPCEMENQQYHLDKIREENPETCCWLWEKESFTEWFDPQYSAATSSTLLWINGKPGAGKTVIASAVVDKARKLVPTPTVLYFYFKHGVKDQDDFVSMARTLLMQLLEQNPLYLDFLYSKCCNSAGALLTSRSRIEELLAFLLRNCDSAYIVLDGLDECSSRKERGEIVKWFRAIIERPDPDPCDHLHCLFVSRHDSARKDYQDIPSMTLDTFNNRKDIESFCVTQSKNLENELGIPAETARKIAFSVSRSAEGIFLFAELAWVNLRSQATLAGLEKEMKSLPTDPENLDDMYARIMKTILDKPVASRFEPLEILSWLVCAKRPLKMHEVQMMKSINVNERAVEFEYRHFRVHIKQLCESLVDVREDGTLELIHTTARSYLARSNHLDIVDTELNLAALCIDYLNLPYFTGSPLETDVLAGAYGFMEYALVHWLRHLEAGMTSYQVENRERHLDLAESFGILVELHWNHPQNLSRTIPRRIYDVLAQFIEHPKHQQMLQAAAWMDSELKHYGDARPEQPALDFLNILPPVRGLIEDIGVRSQNNESVQAMKIKYGARLFKCPRLSCNYFTEGFHTANERDDHIERHDRPARCDDEHCSGSKIGYATRAQLERHKNESHPEVIGLRHIFPTEEEIEQSLQDEFSESEHETEVELQSDHDEHEDPQQENSSPPAAVSMEPSPAKIRIGPPENPKRQKTRHEYHCTHCDRKFSKKYNWTSHLTSHGLGNKVFECSGCEKTFPRSSDLKRHKKLHDPTNAVICGGILPSGRRWGCGETFARADTLNNHHKSQKGGQCIAERDSLD
ncbi:unnamed protein product [Periconia digitata]|uniref:Uncharacterized protein n=1 Tax=Periconia digitata TaxID=1303443 RepID=A0A9W4U6P8_9PLEO|nr:unnamed protein product [Periconia digitata]